MEQSEEKWHEMATQLAMELEYVLYDWYKYKNIPTLAIKQLLDDYYKLENPCDPSDAS